MSEQLWTVEEEDAPTGADGRQLTERGARTRTRLLRAAESVFAAHGYHDASIVKITEAAEVGQGTFYLYFESKKQIFDELVIDLNRQVRRAMSEHSENATSRIARERAGFQGYFKFASEHPALYRIIRLAETVSPEVLKEHYRRISEGYQTGLAEAMEAGDIAPGDPAVLAWMLMGIGEIIGMRWVSWGSTDSVPDDVFDQMYQFVSRGLGAKGAS